MTQREHHWSSEEPEHLIDAAARSGSGRRWVVGWTLAIAMGGIGLVFVVWALSQRDQTPSRAARTRLFHNQSDPDGYERVLVQWWDPAPDDLSAAAQLAPTDTASNIHPDDYVGPDACAQCHRKNHANWSNHPHRWMNARLPHTNVKGDFSGSATISFLGGTATFFTQDDKLRMRLTREATREYEVTQTIGSRFFQYYIGRQIDGPTEGFRGFYEEEHVLAFGYWIDRHEWVPIVHIHEELPDGRRADPFAPNDSQEGFVVYSRDCDVCHTTAPLGDLLAGNPDIAARHIPSDLHFNAGDYLAEFRADFLMRYPELATFSAEGCDEIAASLNERIASEYTVSLGISCEACHLGSRQHAENPRVLPKFFPVSPHVLTTVESGQIEYGRSHANVNWVCGRCHAGNRPRFANGASTWNSTEYSDAMRGSCYSELRCVDCHNPHQATGAKWTKTAEQDDAVCLKCHDRMTDTVVRQQHTHHVSGSEGSRCLNCHMPHLNEGLQDVVRTHMISSPTSESMIQANHPNACNLCHLDKPIGWTLDHLQSWYGKTYSPDVLDLAYPDRNKPLGLTWLESDNEAVRLVAAAAAFRNNTTWLTPELIEALDDPYLLNRQFARIGLERMLGVNLDEFGYRFYMTRDERAKPLQRLREHLLSATDATGDETTGAAGNRPVGSHASASWPE